MAIRMASQSETELILNYSLVVLKEATMGHVTPKKTKALELIIPFLAEGGYYLIDIENNAIRGWICIGSTVNHYTDERIGVIPEIYVVPEFRNKGLAKALLSTAYKHLKDAGYKKVQLNVFEGNIAKPLYQKLGFREVATVMERNL